LQQSGRFRTHTFIFALLPQFNKYLGIFIVLIGLIPGLDHALKFVPLFKAFLRMFLLIPEIRFSYFRLEFFDLLTLVVKVKDTSSARRALQQAD
jgi:hypothetical protein